MARKRKPESRKAGSEERMKWIAEQEPFCPEPTFSFPEGSAVRVGALRNCVVKAVSEDGRFYEIEHDARDRNAEGRETTFFPFYGVRPILNDDDDESLVRNDDVRFTFMNQTIDSLIGKVLRFGVDMNPPYQRDLVWTQEDKERLIDSVFSNVEIGKFAFIHRPFISADSPTYEILDGKQRLTAILDFYLDKFRYKGKTFSELSGWDARWFRNFPVAVAECREEITEKQKIRYFLMLNTTGRSVSEEHLDKVRNLLEKIEEEDGLKTHE